MSKDRFIENLKRDPNLPRFDNTRAKEILQDRMPVMALSGVGRLRLMSALRNRFGEDFKNNSQASGVLKDFDFQLDTLRTFINIKRNRKDGN